MTYSDAIKYITEMPRFKKQAGLLAIKSIMNYLGNPQDKVKIIHIAGTNGKGSVAAFCSEILKSAGFQTGLFISPFVFKWNERISVNGNQIENEEILPIFEKVKRAMEIVGEPITSFEFTMAMAFLYFAEKKCDYIVLETGIGGRWDSTNIVKTTKVSVITQIDFDHMEILGNILTEIADQKGGIIKANSPTVLLPQENEVMEKIKDIAKKQNSKLIIPQIPVAKEYDMTGTVFDYKDYKDLKISMLGKHQIKNAVEAIEAVLELECKISHEAIRKGLLDAKNIARFEVVSTNPLIVLDAAHNASGMQAFKESVEMYFADKHKIFLMGMLGNKEFEKCAKIAAPLADLFVGVSIDVPKSATGEQIVEAAGKGKAASSEFEAAKIAFENMKTESVIFIFGSIYFLDGMFKQLHSLF